MNQIIIFDTILIHLILFIIFEWHQVIKDLESNCDPFDAIFLFIIFEWHQVAQDMKSNYHFGYNPDPLDAIYYF
ncbi:Hypothetical protein KVN_LOCUS377 [uncultured virus]|nr:Hypothetical protein KVN_LOCUS377 [uncultured virus]